MIYWICHIEKIQIANQNLQTANQNQFWLAVPANQVNYYPCTSKFSSIKLTISLLTILNLVQTGPSLGNVHGVHRTWWLSPSCCIQAPDISFHKLQPWMTLVPLLYRTGFVCNLYTITAFSLGTGGFARLLPENRRQLFQNQKSFLVQYVLRHKSEWNWSIYLFSTRTKIAKFVRNNVKVHSLPCSRGIL